MNRHLLALAGALAMLSPAHALDIQLPAETATLHPGASPGAQSAAQCLMCHSVDYLSTQPPMPLGFWEAEVKKMVAVYGAPIAPDQAQLIIQYLNQAYPAPAAPPPRSKPDREGRAGQPARHAGVPLSAYHWATPARGTAGRFSRPACSSRFGQHRPARRARARAGARPARQHTVPCPSRRSGSSGSPTCSPTWAPGRSPSPRPGSSPPNRAARCWSP